MAMPSEPWLAALLDDPLTRLDDFPDHPALRIPPLQDPKPPQTSRRPLPLEPNAGIDKATHTGTMKLGGRMKALAEALPIHDDGPGMAMANTVSKESRTTTGRGSTSDGWRPLSQEQSSGSESANGLRSLAPSSSLRKRKRSDDDEVLGTFVQLPRPPSKQRTDKYLPFQPMATLSGLNEPPPNAALFPPITPSASQDATVGNILNANTTADSKSKVLERIDATVKNHKSISSTRAATKKEPLKRPKWTDAETDELLRGVARFGVGRWKRILNHPDFTFSARTAVDLKDRFRVCCPEGFHKPSNADVPTAESSNNERSLTPQDANETGTEPLKRRSRHRRRPEDLARLGIVAPFASAKRKERRFYTEEEDSNLLKGFNLYGPQWATIQKDSTLNLQERRAMDLRDRFRIRYSDLYAQAGYVPKPQNDRPKLVTPIASNEEELQQVSKSFSPLPGLAAVLPPLSDSLTPPSSILEEKVAEAPESEDPRKAHHDFRGTLFNGSLNETRNAPDPPPSLQEDTATLFGEWEDNTLPPLALSWEEMVARPIFDMD